jgi:hypothetical protein
MNLKPKLEDYTEFEFLQLLNEFFNSTTTLTGEERDHYIIGLVEHFNKVTEHPAKSDLIFYPRDDREDSPVGILEEVKTWRRLNGKSGFKVP